MSECNFDSARSSIKEMEHPSIKQAAGGFDAFKYGFPPSA
jgi:hypothetical protein